MITLLPMRVMGQCEHTSNENSIKQIFSARDKLKTVSQPDPV